jgi:phosphoadenosine phosphosulfate reductase
MQQLNIFGQTVEESAIEFLQKNEPPEGYYLGFSGGKDSIVSKQLCIDAGVKYSAYYSATGIDPPELCKYIKKHHPDVIWLRPKLNFYKGILKKQFPTKFRRWCCDELKKKPGLKIPLKNRIMGIRAEESWKRANRANPDFNEKLKHWTYKPIFHWRQYEVWEYIERHNLPYCSLYDEGFDRIGCIICPYLCYPNSKNLKIHKERWPKQYAAFENIMKKYFDLKGHKLREETAEELIKNWYNGN